MPSASDERRARVVTETERVRSSALSCNNMRVSVVLPAPEGEERINKRPRRLVAMAGSLDILNLFAQLLDLAAQIEADRSQGDVVRLGAERIGLARQFLREKIEPPADWPAGAHQFARRRHMGRQPIELLANIGLGGQKHRLLMKAVLVEAAAGL